MPAYFLTERDHQLLQRFLRAARREPQNIRGQSFERQKMLEAEGHQSPEVYLALPPEDGIPPILRSQLTHEIEDQLGSAVCQIYRMINGIAYPVSNVTRLVYNPTDSYIPRYLDIAIGTGGTGDYPNWIPVHKTKFGQWIVGMGAGTPNYVGYTTEDIDNNELGLISIQGTFCDISSVGPRGLLTADTHIPACNSLNTRLWIGTKVGIIWAHSRWFIVENYSATIVLGYAETNAVTGDTVTLNGVQGMNGIYKSVLIFDVYVVNGPVIAGEYYHAFWNDEELRWEIGGSGDVQCTDIHIPTNDAPGIYSHLYVSDRDTISGVIHEQLQWSEQGVDGEVYVAHCNLTDCFTITIQKGLITEISGPVVNYYDPPAGDLGTIETPDVFAKTQCGTAFT